ncbi:hypothetical protein [Microlunatus sp. GCM10028923]|uniref:hypothetical protein n=1 Tax=Microlunatus sp. GCM10028923 TaxID=3273400 RepID=UPI0036174366
MVRITEETIATLKAYLTGDYEGVVRGFERLRWGSEHLTREVPGFLELLAAALIVAARRHFGDTYTRAEIVQYVATIRRRELIMGDFDPLTGEILILRALGADDEVLLDLNRQIVAQIALLEEFARDADLDAKQVDELLDEAKVNAQVWFRRTDSVVADIGSVAEQELKTISSIYIPQSDRPIFSFADMEEFKIGDERVGTRFGVGSSGESFLWFTEGNGGIYVQSGPTAVFANSRLESFTASLISVSALSVPPTGGPADVDRYLLDVEQVRSELGRIDSQAMDERAWWPGVLDRFARAVAR